ncbi:MAG: MerR family transcriptional regulator [Deltaproteobacteria bacterium]|nr:MerR family transcriptional regulator [Deltaproteobacteria bacterium]
MASRVAFPDKLYFKIGEVANLTEVKQHVLRYWESEFPSIRPQKSKSNQRLYRRRDVEAVLAVKHLLYERKFTIEGAKKHLKDEGIDTSLPPPDPEEVAAHARAEALEEMNDLAGRARAQLLREHEKQLLMLRQQLVDFQKDLPDEDKE